jgi:hypothetical protein
MSFWFYRNCVFVLFNQISAWDEDVGINSQLTYWTQSGNEDSVFSLSPNGTFHVLNILDREKQPQYILSIIAVDAGN